MKYFYFLLCIGMLTSACKTVQTTLTPAQIMQDAKLYYDNPEAVIYQCKEPLIAKKNLMLNAPTNFGGLITRGMALSSKNTSYGAIINANAFQIDEVFDTELKVIDIFSAIPAKDQVWNVMIRGPELKKVLDASLKNRGKDGFFQLDRILYNAKSSEWIIGKRALQENRNYPIAVAASLMSGKVPNLEFFNEKNENIIEIKKPDVTDATDLRNDIRRAVVEYLKRQ